ncbi:MAG: hypothetical protein F6K18_18415 [Okeania sp. SIO2C2]|uniref:hypothetical protein n=1 Tax=Okeania sp. SIO2C2 TaxID=2607787 RepID=UPI0013B9CAA1|nr:hypothetical protein [Okeania sp. SIO2C2]NEP88649.1 hypothetical protein [Okeania sp. SIO2C2]
MTIEDFFYVQLNGFDITHIKHFLRFFSENFFPVAFLDAFSFASVEPRGVAQLLPISAKSLFFFGDV